jgi:hypothetical protein
MNYKQQLQTETTHIVYPLIFPFNQSEKSCTSFQRLFLVNNIA